VSQLKLNYTVPNSKKVYLVPQNNTPWVSTGTPQFFIGSWCNNFQNITSRPQLQRQIEPFTPEKLRELLGYLKERAKNTK
jgi:hypothetical protein